MRDQGGSCTEVPTTAVTGMTSLPRSPAATCPEARGPTVPIWTREARVRGGVWTKGAVPKDPVLTPSSKARKRRSHQGGRHSFAFWGSLGLQCRVGTGLQKESGMWPAVPVSQGCPPPQRLLRSKEAGPDFPATSEGHLRHAVCCPCRLCGMRPRAGWWLFTVMEWG